MLYLFSINFIFSYFRISFFIFVRRNRFFLKQLIYLCVFIFMNEFNPLMPLYKRDATRKITQNFENFRQQLKKNVHGKQMKIRI